jgi:hypothetical protein
MNAGSVGSGLWSTQKALFPHLAQGFHGLIGEVADVRRDLSIVLTPLKAVTVEEYDAPTAAVANNIMPVTATQTAAVSYTYLQLTGTLGSGVISPPRNIEVVTAGATPTHAPADFVITGLDAWGRSITETISGTNGGAATYAGVKCFAKVLGVSAPAGTGTDATFSVGTGIVIGLSQYQRLRTGQLLGLVSREIVDGALVSPVTGVLTSSTTNPPFGAYTPATPPSAPTPAVVTGSVNLNAGGTYGATGTLSNSGANNLVLAMTVNGLVATLTLNGGTNAASASALLAAIDLTWPGLTATINGSGFLVLTDKLSGASYSIFFPTDATNTAYLVLGVGGVGGGTTSGTGHSYAIDYEMDGSRQPTYQAIGTPGPIVPPPGSGAPSV